MRTFTTLATAAALFGILQFAGSAQTGGSVRRVQAQAIDELRTWDRYIDEHERAKDLRRRSTDHDPLLPAQTIERFQQFYRGVPVWGADIVRVSDMGSAISIFGALAPDLNLDVDAALSETEGEQALLQMGGPEAKALTRVELVVVQLDGGDYRLAYSAVISAGNAVNRIFVDANTGSELRRVSEIQTDAAVATGLGVLGDTKKLSVSREAGMYFADDQLRPPALRTYDMRGSLTHAVNILNGAALFPGDRASDIDDRWNDPIAVDAQAQIGLTYDYYYKRFGRRGLDNRDRPITALINAVTAQGALSLSLNDLGQFAVQAFWCGSCGPNQTGLMYFGNGIPPQNVFTSAVPDLSGQTVGPLAGSLDVIAHELTHGVISSTPGLLNSGEPGALDEAFADMMGTSVEFFYQPRGDGLRQADYLMGEDSFRGVTTTRNGIRSLQNPQAYTQGGAPSPDHYLRRYTGSGDSGGRHINAGIPGNAFYLAIEGGTNRTSGLSTQGVGPSNREQIEKVFYRAFTFLLPQNASFSTARAATIQAARDLYGPGSAPERAVTQAWTAVGVN
ncbi:MAG TPA: M4 family metallopeptidase [Vicinamibacterales bacterium]|nr:M4 family metallopeptidase [Vicinamibacterales bacterium]